MSKVRWRLATPEEEYELSYWVCVGGINSKLGSCEHRKPPGEYPKKRKGDCPYCKPGKKTVEYNADNP
jgi:hypothetical protein